MKVTVLGSGGALMTPRPGCACRVCASARANPGEWRAEPSVYVHDAALLVDAPEDIVPSLNRAGIDRVDHLFISHWHPDHCAGLRVVETLTWDLAKAGASRAIDVWLNETTLARYRSDWRYFEAKGHCRLHVIRHGAIDRIGRLEVRWFGYSTDDFLTGAVLSDGTTRAIVAMDETKGLADKLATEPWAHECVLAILETGWLEHGFDGQRLWPEDAPFKPTEAGFERDTLPLVRTLRPKRAVLLHVNGCLMGRTPTELDDLAAQHADLPITFARDGLTVSTD